MNLIKLKFVYMLSMKIYICPTHSPYYHYPTKVNPHEAQSFDKPSKPFISSSDFGFTRCRHFLCLQFGYFLCFNFHEQSVTEAIHSSK